MSTTMHRFTPPTCTLEIEGEKFLLFPWKKQNLLKNHQFQLKFDDPRVPSSQQVTIKGDRQDLEQLQQAVNVYVGEFLYASFQPATTATKLKTNNRFQPNQPYLQSQGLVNHELFLGSLSHDSNNHQIKLSTLQLFDLVTALAAYQTEIAARSEKQAQSTAIPLWGGIAAATIAAVGIAIVAIESRSPRLASSPQSQPSAEIIESDELDEVIPPQAPKTARPTAKPQLSEPLTSAKKLPPPPAVDTPKPKPDIPDPADYPLPDVARQSGLSNSIPDPTANRQTESTIAIPPQTKEDINTKLTQPNIASRSETASDFDFKQELELGDSAVKPAEDLAQSNEDDNLATNSYSTPNVQLQEVTAYFQEQWQPPAELKQSLEYRLFFDNDGSIKRVISLGKAAELYLSKTNIPLDGESFISPSETQPVIRLLLNPNGRVQAFIE
ncbi:DUF4335 domain-containing protein [Pleurocapsales cyanobacterium LEGE 10410]|nr:DUF4335 domain-containing protein [Pleurocapsales cyanobacterium LEGE 10410]